MRGITLTGICKILIGKAITRISLAGTLLLLIFACEGFLGNNNRDAMRETVLPEFNTMTVKGIFDIELVQDTITKIVLEGKDDEVDNVSIFIKNDTLIIIGRRNNNPLKKSAKICLTLHFRNLSVLWTYDPVRIECRDTLRLESFSYHGIGEISEANLKVVSHYFHVGSSLNTLGHVYLSGRSEYLSIFNRYGSVVFAEKLICRSADIMNQSAGDVFVNVSDLITARLWGTGNIYYYGVPEIQVLERISTGNIFSAR